MRFLVDECTGPSAAQRLRENSASEMPGRFLVVTEKTVRIAGHI